MIKPSCEGATRLYAEENANHIPKNAGIFDAAPRHGQGRPVSAVIFTTVVGAGYMVE